MFWSHNNFTLVCNLAVLSITTCSSLFFFHANHNYLFVIDSENKGGHIPYRDSKLTRILQLSLDGNARTAIICTMSPSKSNMELSRNTLFFAMSAKKVTNTAQVNMVRSFYLLIRFQFCLVEHSGSMVPNQS